MQERPDLLSASAILFLIFGVISVFGVLSSGFMFLAGASTPGLAENPAIVAMKEVPEYALMMKMMILPTLVAAVIGIMVGLGQLKGREWARKGGIALALWNILSTGLGTWATLKYVSPRMEASVQSVLATLPNKGGEMPPEALVGMMRASMNAGAISGSLFWVGCSVALIILLTRPSVVAFCKGPAPVPSAT